MQTKESGQKWQAVVDASGGKFLSRFAEIHALCSEITQAEVRVIFLSEEGYDTWQIAGLLKITYHSVENYRRRVRKKMGVPGSIPFALLFKK